MDRAPDPLASTTRDLNEEFGRAPNTTARPTATHPVPDASNRFDPPTANEPARDSSPGVVDAALGGARVMYCIERGPVDDRRPIAVVAALHGDEPCGAYAIADLLATDPVFHRRVKFVVANERAMAAQQRFVDDDLNRAFPGCPYSRSHERRLAARLREELADAEVLTLHSTDAEPTPFALMQHPGETTDAVVRATGLEHVVDISYVDGGLEDVVDGVAVECGPMRTRAAAESAREILERFLTARGALPGDVDPTDPDVYRVEDTVDRGDLAFTGRNFQRVDAGETFAVETGGDEREITAESAFTPVLMASDGYDDMLGFQATHVGTLSDLDD